MVLPKFGTGVMQFTTLAILALIQGITEFLPVSSSAHLILLPQLTGTEDQGIAVDVAVHFGTLFAVILFFKSDVADAISGGFDILKGRFGTANARLASLLILATIPVIVAGLILKMTGLSDSMRDIRVIGWAMIIFGIALYWFDKTATTTRTAVSWRWKDALIMGLWQMLALIPGTSRSGATITGARQLGFNRKDGAKLAMLMSIPTILASASLISVDIVTGDASVNIKDLLIGAVLAFLAALLALKLMMQLLNSFSFTPYVIYRLLLGAALLWIAYT